MPAAAFKNPDNLGPISAATPPAMLQQTLPVTKLRKQITYVCIERVPQASGNATGTVEVWARWETGVGFSKMATVDLAASGEIDITPLNGVFPEIKLVLNNVVGAFWWTWTGY